MPDVPYHALPLRDEDLLQLLHQHLHGNEGGCKGVSALEVSEVLLKFYDEPYALHCHRNWLCTALQVPRTERAVLDSLRSHVQEQFQQSGGCPTARRDADSRFIVCSAPWSLPALSSMAS